MVHPIQLIGALDERFVFGGELWKMFPELVSHVRSQILVSCS